MPCYNPQRIYLTPSGWRFAPKRNTVFEDAGSKHVSCQQCLGCRLERSRQWALRSVHEAQFHEENYFLTLTFDDDHVPADGSLNTKTIQGFWKRFRKAHPLMRFKYYAAGEYGEKYARPHYHASVFGMELPDLYKTFKTKSGFQMYSSPSLEKAWPFGNIYVSDLTFETAAYVARYICKKVLGKGADEHYSKLGILPERAWISKGLGKEWHETYKHETYRDNYVSCRGVPSVPPRTYNRWLKESDPDCYRKYELSTAKSFEEQQKVVEDILSGRYDIMKEVKEASMRAGKLDLTR